MNPIFENFSIDPLGTNSEEKIDAKNRDFVLDCLKNTIGLMTSENHTLKMIIVFFLMKEGYTEEKIDAYFAKLSNIIYGGYDEGSESDNE